MLKAILLLSLSLSALAQDQFATVSLQRWANKLVVTIDHDPDWHTYWKNPGDAGIATVFKFQQEGKKLDPSAFEWPVPKMYLEAGDILTIGYAGTQHFFFEDIAGAFDAHVGFLICKDICIPGEAKLQLGVNQNFAASRNAQPFSPVDLRKAFEALPTDIPIPAGLEYYVTRKKGENLLTLHYSLKGVDSQTLPVKLPFLTGFPNPPFGFKREALYFKDNTLYGKTEIEWDGEYQDPVVPLPDDGQFGKSYDLKFLLNAPGSKSVKSVTLPLKNFSLSTPALDEFYSSLSTPDSSNPSSGSSANLSIFQYLLFAFLGGLILNLMPCVLPVISLKLFGLIKHKDTPRKQLVSHNLAYTAGVISTFMALGLVIVGIKVTGEEVGWGFQLQSPTFVLVMMLVIFIFSLNLFGLFEFVTPGGRTLANQQLSEGFSGDFFTGVLTTILSTPCSAPFLGTALAFAFTTSFLMIFVMFFFIGLGLAFPFLVTAFFPATISFLPKPGAWMEKLKYFLGLSLVATVVWLYDVFVSLVDFDRISWRLNLLFVFWFFAFFVYKKISSRPWVTILAFAFPLVLTGMAVNSLELRPSGAEARVASSNWLPWSEEALLEQRGKPVFIDFTAEWCLTCKVNKKLVLETSAFEALVKEKGLILMRADWTRRDDRITQFLKRYNAVGVPAYFVQKVDGSIHFLGETVSVDKIQKNLD